MTKRRCEGHEYDEHGRLHDCERIASWKTGVLYSDDGEHFVCSKHIADFMEWHQVNTVVLIGGGAD